MMTGRWPTIGAMQRDELAALVALLSRDTRWREVTDAVLDADSAMTVLEGRFADGATLFPQLDSVRTALRDARDRIAGWRAEGVGIHTCMDEEYPAQLRDIYQMPPILFSRGDLQEDHRAIAVVGTRQASEQGVETATRVARALAQHGVTVVSGLAAGIDTAAHRAALDVGGRTVAVIGTGVNRQYPRQNAELQRMIAERGLVLSQFWPDAPPGKRTFLMRNAVMSGYAAATVVIEANWKSGARSQAWRALEHGRPVILPVELLRHDWARELSERPGTEVVDGPEELLAAAERVIGDQELTLDSLQEITPLDWS